MRSLLIRLIDKRGHTWSDYEFLTQNWNGNENNKYCFTVVYVYNF